MNGCCYIVGAGSLYGGDLPLNLQENDLLIAADGGYEYLKQAGMSPHLLIGDFDSMDKPLADCEIITLPVEKDDTDIAFGVKEGFRRGYTRFVIYGGLGGARLSHTLANIQLLVFIKEQGGDGVLVGGDTRVFLLNRETKAFSEGTKGTCSVFAYGGNATVSLQGLQYPLDQAILSPAFPLGVSNHFTEQQAIITVHSGTVVVVTEQ